MPPTKFLPSVNGRPGGSPAVLLPSPQGAKGRRPPLQMQVRGSAYRALSNEFIADLHEAWLQYGKKALEVTTTEHPQIFVQVVARLAQIHRVEVGGPGEFASAMNRAQLLDEVGERFGQKGRDMFERFVAQLDRLRADREGAAGE